MLHPDPDNSENLIYFLSISYIDPNLEDQIIAVLDFAGIDALEQDDLLIKVYHTDDSLLEKARNLLGQVFKGKIEIQRDSMAAKNWNRQWEESITAISIDGFCTIHTSFHKEFNRNPIEIVIDPEMAFGTGHHETTWLMMRQMSEMDFHSQTVLDYGCGTAVLGILAEKMGAKTVLAIDNDPVAIRCAQDCLEKNYCKNIGLRCALLDEVEDSDFDIILANINRNVLLNAASRLSSLQKKNGLLLLSGLLIEDVEAVKSTYLVTNYEFIREESKGGWSSLLFKR